MPFSTVFIQVNRCYIISKTDTSGQWFQFSKAFYIFHELIVYFWAMAILVWCRTLQCTICRTTYDALGPIHVVFAESQTLLYGAWSKGLELRVEFNPSPGIYLKQKSTTTTAYTVLSILFWLKHYYLNGIWNDMDWTNISNSEWCSPMTPEQSIVWQWMMVHSHH